MEMIHEATHLARQQSARQEAQAALAAASGAPATASGGQFLTFRLGEEEFGIDILRVQEIRSYEAPTRIANSPSCLKGVVNLRGVIVPIVDLRIKLGFDKVEYDAFTVVIVLNLKGRVVGAVVDSVSDVITLAGEKIQPAPELISRIDSNCITGIATVPGAEGDRMLILMDIESMINCHEMGLATAG